MALTDGATSQPVSAAPVQPRQAKGKVRPPRDKSGQVAATARDRLTLKEREFIGQCCLNGFKPTEACRTLGMGGAYPHVLASRMMKRPAVKAEFDNRLKAKESLAISAAEVTIDKIAARYAELAFAQHDGPLTASNVLAALDSLGKWRGMFKPDQVTVVPVTFQFIGGPDLTAGTVLEAVQERVAGPSTGTVDSPGLGKPERG